MLSGFVVILNSYPENLRSSASHYGFCGALNYVEFRAAMHPTWCMAEREGFEPSVPLLAEHTISSRAPSASSVISPQLQKFKLVGHRYTQMNTEKNLSSNFRFQLYFSNLCLSVSHSILFGALNYVEFKAAMHPTWCMAERVGFEPT